MSSPTLFLIMTLGLGLVVLGLLVIPRPPLTPARWLTRLWRRFCLRPVIFNHLRDGVLAVGPGGAILDASPMIERWTGQSAAELIGQPLAQVAPRLGLNPAQLVITTNPLEFQIDHGLHRFEVQVSALPSRRGQPAGRLINIRDIAERKRADQSAEQAYSAHLTTLAAVVTELSKAPTLDDLCRQAVEAARDRLGFDRLALWFVTPDHTTMLGTFGTGPDGQTTDERQARHPISKTSHIWPIVEGHLALYRYENAPLYQMDSQQIGQGERVTVGLWDGETVIGFLSVDNFLRHRPFTQHDCELLHLYASALGHLCTLKRVQEALTQLAEALEARVTERTAELEAFAYSVSHDLRAPLRVIDGFTRLLVEDHAAALGPEGQRLCAIVRDKTHQMDQLIDDLLTFSRFSRADLQKSPIEMAPLVAAVFQELTTPAERERIDLQIEPLPSAWGDPALIHQVWVNLISNAIKFSARRARPTIRVTGQPASEAIVYAVADNGAGFNMEYAHKLFGVFQRLHSEQEFEGTGIGLAIIQRIIRRHGGRVWAEGVPDRGATFYFTLDRAGPLI